MNPAMPVLLLFLLSRVVLTVPQTIHALEAADLNHHGLLDPVTQSSTGYAVHLNRKHFRFALSQRIERIGIGEPGGMALVGVNHDGHIDLISGSHDSYRLAVLPNDGSGRFTPATGSPFFPRRYGKPHNHRIAAADLNGDTHPGIVTANIGAGNLGIFLGDGKGAFHLSGQQLPPLAVDADLSVHADFDIDRTPDWLSVDRDTGTVRITVAQALP